MYTLMHGEWPACIHACMSPLAKTGGGQGTRAAHGLATARTGSARLLYLDTLRMIRADNPRRTKAGKSYAAWPAPTHLPQPPYVHAPVPALPSSGLFPGGFPPQQWFGIFHQVHVSVAAEMRLDAMHACALPTHLPSVHVLECCREVVEDAQTSSGVGGLPEQAGVQALVEREEAVLLDDVAGNGKLGQREGGGRG